MQAQAYLGWGRVVVGGIRQEAVIHLSHTRRQLLGVPGMLLHLAEGDALRRVGCQDLRQQVLALGRHDCMRGQSILHLQNPLQHPDRMSADKTQSAMCMHAWHGVHLHELALEATWFTEVASANSPGIGLPQQLNAEARLAST